jgi:hypothetical protein
MSDVDEVLLEESGAENELDVINPLTGRSSIIHAFLGLAGE